MSVSPTSEYTPDSPFTCACSVWDRDACVGESFYKEHGGKRYCVLHFPGKDKSADFDLALQRKINANDYSFEAVWFPHYVSFTNKRINVIANFRGATFCDTAHFLETQFNAGADFCNATFHGEANFGASNFALGASFFDTTFNASAIFRYTKLENSRFNRSIFNGEVDFTDVSFDGEAYFNNAIFKDYVRFANDNRSGPFGDKPALSFQHARFDKPERVSFHSVTLRPHWFINADVRKFEFTNVEWHGLTKEEIKALQIYKNLPSHRLHRLLARACRQLAVNEEENHRYEEASKLRYMAMDTRRLESWSGFAPWRISWWYWLASGYGERVFQAFVVLIGIWLLSALLYTQVGFARWEPRLASESDVATTKRDEVGTPLRLSRALTYSLG